MVRKSKKFGPPYSSLVRSIEDRLLRSNSQLGGSPKRDRMVQNGTEVQKTLKESNLEWPNMAHKTENPPNWAMPDLTPGKIWMRGNERK